MVKNLDVSTYRDGTPIPQVTDPSKWAVLTTGAWCWYNDDSATYAGTYGKLYNWYAVNDPRGLAPTGWRVPRNAEWTILETYLGGADKAGGKMKVTGTTTWISPNTGATNSSNWTGQPGGSRDIFLSYVLFGRDGLWWSSTEFSAAKAWYRSLYNDLNLIGKNVEIKQLGLSVRCIRDLGLVFVSKAQDYLEKGNMEYTLKEYKGAVADFSKAIEIDPNNSEAYFFRGNAKHELQDYKGAIADYDKAIEINPNYAPAYSNRGIEKSHLQDYKGAIADFSKAIEINPNYAPAYSNRGMTNIYIQDYKGAIADYSKAIEINPNYAPDNSNRGLAKIYLQDYRGAIADFSKAIEINPNYAPAYGNRGMTNIYIQDYKGAIADFSKAIEINPNNSDAYINRGLAKIELGQKESGCLDLRKAGLLGNEKASQVINKYCK